MTMNAVLKPAAGIAAMISPDPWAELESRIFLVDSRAVPCRLTTLLGDYWCLVAATPIDSRREWADSVRRRYRCGLLDASVLALIALGDTDDRLVHDATLDYVTQGPVSLEQREAAFDDSLDWLRRGLTLNRGAVFAALVSVGDESVLQRLATIRLTLSIDEIDVVCRLLAGRARNLPRQFIGNWFELLNQAPVHEAATRLSALLSGSSPAAVACQSVS
jgi:hypothetical protein